MGKAAFILNSIRQFTPAGQEMALGLMKKNKKLLKNNPLGFMDLLGEASKTGNLRALQKELVNPNMTVRSVTRSGLASYAESLSKTTKQEDFFDVIINSHDYMAKSFQKMRLDLLSENFGTKKNKLAEFIQKEFPKNKNLQLHITKANTPDDLMQVIDDLSFNIDNSYQTMMGRLALQSRIKVPALFFKDFRVMQKNTQAAQKIADMKLNLQKILLKQSEDSRVRHIEDVLREKYGMHYVNLGNIRDAENILHTTEVALKNNIPLPDIVIVTPYLQASEKGLNTMCSKGLRMVMINSNQSSADIKKFIGNSNVSKEIKDLYGCHMQNQLISSYSTNNPLHVYLHEYIHSENPLVYTSKKIDKKYQETVSNLSEYARRAFNKGNEEIRTEFRTKECIEGLSADEKSLLNYLS